MLDLPRIHGNRAGDAFDMRSYWSLCVDEFSSKTWTRVGPPLKKTWTMLPPEILSSVVGEYRALANSCGEWIHREFRRLTQAVLGKSRRGHTFEITTVGLRVHGDVNEDLLDEWLFAYDKDGAEGPNFENDSLCRFLADAAGLDFHPRELEKRAAGFWMSIPGAVELANGDVVTRRVLYLVRPAGKTFVQVVGIGLDDSRAGDLAPEVVLKASRLLAGGI